MSELSIHAPFSSLSSVVIWIAAGILFAMLFIDFLSRKTANEIYSYLKEKGADEAGGAVPTEDILENVRGAGRFLKKAEKSAYLKRFIGRTDLSDGNGGKKDISCSRWFIRNESDFLKRKGENSIGKFIIGAVFLFVFALLIDLFFDTIVGFFVSSRNLFNLF